MDEKIRLDTDNYEGGFYYDTQRKNPLMSVTLHPNTIQKEDGTWVAPRAIEKGSDQVETGYPDKSKIYDFHYLDEPICRAISNEDFQVSINNDWTSFETGDVATAFFQQFKSGAAMISFARNMSDRAKVAMDKLLNSDNKAAYENSFVFKAVQGINGFIGKTLDIATDYANKALVVQGTRFTYYSGTGFNFGNLNMRFYLFPDWFVTEDGQVVFKTVYEQLKDIYPYALGKYRAFVGEDTKMKTYLESIGLGGDKAGDINNVLNLVLGWQDPPAGYEADFRSVDVLQKGTLELRIGSFYRIKNLVIRDIQHNFSRQMAKFPVRGQEGKISPLYCEVILSLSPVTRYSDRSLLEFIGGSASQRDREKLGFEISDKLSQMSHKLNQGMEKQEFFYNNSPAYVPTFLDPTAEEIPSYPDVSTPWWEGTNPYQDDSTPPAIAEGLGQSTNWNQ